ncbi:unnamed protein product [Clonostachys rosea]|uniref:Solute carrier family 40 member n=1 Tax=Bionectria ochroleuca TaxID=29856 RepID=A0ABY6UEP6_BIOOC|nr:unnamed protein product [Clonostachys rosea]
MSTTSSPTCDGREADEHAALLGSNIPGRDSKSLDRSYSQDGSTDAPSTLACRLYVSHFLSTWNSRVFEFGAVLYLATIYPGTLLPMSVYAFTRGLSAILFASSVGLYIDTGSRIQVVRVSIVGQRIVVAISCVIFYILLVRPSLEQRSKDGLLAVVAFLACIEKLCSILNLVSIEKDWVVVVAGGDQAALTTLNAQMRRIDLVCKLLGPLFIALIDGYSTQIAVLFNLGMNVASVVVEYYAIAQVYHRVPGLQEPKHKTKHQSDPETILPPTQRRERLSHNWDHVCSIFKRTISDFKIYFQHRAFLPSFAGALLYLTVLSFAGQMVTYLLAAGYDSTQIGIARTFSVLFEILATWVAPWLIAKIGPTRAGLWMSSTQIVMLVGGTAVFWVFMQHPFISASGLVIGTILSRLGLRGFDLCAQIIVQNEVEADLRGAFSSVEAGWQNGFELLSYAATMIFSRPDQFKWPTLISVVAVGLASVIYTRYVYSQRKHLLHLSWAYNLTVGKALYSQG